MASHIQSLVKSEKNRQVMCEAGMLRTLMTYCHQALTTSSSPLHSGLIRIFEKLASQAIEPDVLRYRVRHVKCCQAPGGHVSAQGAVRVPPPPPQQWTLQVQGGALGLQQCEARRADVAPPMELMFSGRGIISKGSCRQYRTVLDGMLSSEWEL